MIEVPGWIILNFFTAFLLVLLLVFQNKTSRLQTGKKYSAILIGTLILLIAETIGRIGETYPENYLILAKVGYYVIFLLDPVDILFAINYIDCWMNDDNKKARTYYRSSFEIFSMVNMVAVTLALILDLKLFYYFDGYTYNRGSFFMIRAALIMVFIILLLLYTIIFRKNLLTAYKNTILFLPAFSLLGALLQVFLANLDCTYAGISLGCLIIFFAYQNRDNNMDYLTGVLNRRGLDIKMAEMVKTSQSGKKNFSALMLDIDYFKEINDSFGHDEGDQAIKTMANILVDVFGPDASIGRFGGDEFCVITESLSEMEIESNIKEICHRLEKQKRKHGWNSCINISCGYEVYDHNSNISAPEFMDIIDKRMYVEKQRHHNE